jgi:CheY-like chemotaxis protein
VPPTVLIATTEHLGSFKEREELGDAIMFADTEALKALDVITRQHPDIVLLDRVFADTTRGAALINRIKADPSLGGCEIRIVEDDRRYSQVPSPRIVEATTVAAASLDHMAPIVIEELPTPAPLDQVGTRQAPRYKIIAGIDVEIDGNPATLVDLSIAGAQVVSPTILKPNQRVRFIVPSNKPPMRLKAEVAWAAFEIPRGLSRYRAGIQLFGADPAAMMRFIERNRQ